MQSIVPQEIPPIIRSFRFAFLFSGSSLSGADSAFFPEPIFWIIPITGRRKRPPSSDLDMLKVNGPIYSVPTLWATKAVPQINDARNRRIGPLKLYDP